jgi:hypothetical protein
LRESTHTSYGFINLYIDRRSERLEGILGKEKGQSVYSSVLSSSASHDAVILVGKSSQSFVVGSPPEKMHAHQRSLSWYVFNSISVPNYTVLFF